MIIFYIDLLMDIESSNNSICELLKTDKPFSIVRLGIGYETFSSFILDFQHRYQKFTNRHFKNCGIYSKTNDVKTFLQYSSQYNRAIQNSDLIAVMQAPLVKNIEIHYCNKYKKKPIHSRGLEPFYALDKGYIPWTHYLKNKRVLVINPFVDSFKKQLSNNFQIFNDKKLFDDEQEFIFYKSYQTMSYNFVHEDWVETFNIMCDDIQKLNFDVAILGCGGYGLPLCNFIKDKLNKQAIYIGGGIQLMFGVMGRRWENNEFWRNIIETHDSKFIKPSSEETCENHEKIEGGCYW